MVEMTGIKPVTHTYLGFTMLTFHREHPQLYSWTAILKYTAKY